MSALKAELMGPGSEVSYPDAEHELISEYPSDRYSVGILYPQNNKFGDDSDVKKDELNEDELDTMHFEEKNEEDVKSKQQNILYKDEAFDDEVNMAQQNKPSSMGLTFFVQGNRDDLNINVKYARYTAANDNEIIIPYPYDNLYVPDALSHYIYFDKKFIANMI